MVNPHPDFLARKTAMWENFIEKNYEDAARTAATILQDAFCFDAIHVAGLALAGLDRGEEAFDFLCASLSLASARPDWYANAAIAMMDKKDYLRSMLFIQNGIKEYPEDIRLSYMRGLCLCHAQEWDNAIKFLDETLLLDPNFYHATMSKGFCYHMNGRYEEAIELYKSIYAIAEANDREEVVNNHACVLMELGRQKEALALLDQEYPDSKKPGTVYNRSFLFLGMGYWPEAWHLYRYRATVQVSGDQGLPVVDQPTAHTLEDIKGKHLFLFHEQGLGDTLMFIRYAAMLRPLVSNLTIGVPRTLRRLTEYLKLDSQFNIVTESNNTDIPKDFSIVSDAEVDKPLFTQCDIALPMLDCPAIFNTTPQTIPNDVPYFKVPKEIIEQHQLRDTCKPRIGLIWAGASRPENIRAHSIDKRRSVPYEMLEPILEMHTRFELVSLQLPDHYVEDDRILQPLSWGGAKPGERDVLDTAGVVAQLDLLITIDSSIAHLAGAIGRPVWLLSRWDGCWRWFWPEEGTPLSVHTPWYPTMRLFRQTAHNTWPDVIDRVVKRLKSMSDNDISLMIEKSLI